LVSEKGRITSCKLLLSHYNLSSPVFKGHLFE
jgi:hypothetical protein